MIKTRAGKSGAKQVQALVVGSFGAGKSAFISRVLNEEFPAAHIATLGVELFVKETQTQDDFITINFWSCGGHERFRPLIQNLYDNVSVVILAYDRTSLTSFQEVAYWRNEMLRCFPSSIAFVLGLKSDLKDSVAVPIQEAEEQASRWNLPHWTASSKTGENIDTVFNAMLTNVLDKITVRV